MVLVTLMIYVATDLISFQDVYARCDKPLATWSIVSCMLLACFRLLVLKGQDLSGLADEDQALLEAP